MHRWQSETSEMLRHSVNQTVIQSPDQGGAGLNCPTTWHEERNAAKPLFQPLSLPPSLKSTWLCKLCLHHYPPSLCFVHKGAGIEWGGEAEKDGANEREKGWRYGELRQSGSCGCGGWQRSRRWFTETILRIIVYMICCKGRVSRRPLFQTRRTLLGYKVELDTA